MMVGDNIEREVLNCRICHDDSLPLLRVCACLGSLSFVHELCIKKWISYLYKDKKIKTHPKCELCRCLLSATINFRQPKICYFLLLQHVFNLSPKEKIFFLLLIFLVSGAISMSLFIVFTLIEIIFSLNSIPNIFEIGFNILLILMLKVLFPMYFLESSISLMRKLKKIVKKSRVPVLKIRIIPKIIITQEEE